MPQSTNQPREAEYLVYLRKSRKDREQEKDGMADTLQRHRDALLALAKARRYRIAHIYEEVVSGDTIAERPEMQKLLAAVETGLYTGVLVMEIPRLARGNTRDQGMVAETFQYSGTKIITPDRIYDPADEADEEYFEFGLFMSRREYKSINRRQQRGRLAALHEGKYIAGSAPYGYERIRLRGQKGHSLAILPDRADIVRQIFHIYTQGELQPNGSRRKFGAYTIANLLNQRAIPAPGGGVWSSSSVKEILQNPTYAGYLRWGYRAEEKRMQNGVVVSTNPINKQSTLVDGLHDAIISKETWEAACQIRATRSHTPVPSRSQITNPLAGLLLCSHCGRSLVGLPQQKNKQKLPCLMLRCPTVGCPTVSSQLPEVEAALLDALRLWLEGYQAETDPVQARQDADQLQGIEQDRRRLSVELEKVQQQQNALYDLLEQGLYDKETFLTRSRTLSARANALSLELQTAESRLTRERFAQQTRNDLLPNIERVLHEYHRISDPAIQNRMLKDVLRHAVYRKSQGGRWQASDLTLYLFPLLPQPANDL